MYGRFESGVHPREPLGDLLLSSRDHCTSLEDHVQHLTKVSIDIVNQTFALHEDFTANIQKFLSPGCFSAYNEFQEFNFQVSQETTERVTT